MHKPLLFTICNDKWAIEQNHLKRWQRYAERNSGCRIGLILISDNDQLVAELNEQFDEVVVFDSSSDHRDFYNEIRLHGPRLFGEPCIYCDADADVWGNLSSLLDTDAELMCVPSPAKHEEWTLIDPNAEEYNNGFLVLNYSAERAKEIDKIYKHWKQVAQDAMCTLRIVGTIGFNLMLKAGNLNWKPLPYSTSVIWWDDMAMRDAKVIQWCNDHGQAKRLLLEEEWYRGGEAL